MINQTVIKIASSSLALLLAMTLCLPAQAAEKTWNGSGDGSNWFDDDNWFPATAPTSADDVLVNTPNASSAVSQTFYARSITLAGTAPSSLVVSPFIYGTVAPVADTDVAIDNRRDGALTLKGSAGVITLRGKYKDSEELLTDQPSFVFFVE